MNLHGFTLLLALGMQSGASSGFAACVDTTVTVQNGGPVVASDCGIAIQVDPAASDFPQGRISLKVALGNDPIDSVRVVAVAEGGMVVATVTKASHGGAIAFLISGLPKKAISFHALPIVIINGVAKTGSPSPSTLPFGFLPVESDSGSDIFSHDCLIVTMKTACPGDSSYFIPATGLFNGMFMSRVVFGEAVSSGLVKNPEYIAIPDPRAFHVDLTSPMPMIKLYVTLPGLGYVGLTMLTSRWE